ncbi:GPI19 [[Candida] subhashii]|uniref:GPI19 n=1 Tax=[Candida] subhashii TaxID=561895 RepID=A0A8J5QWC6_9ASCO|nr:GPI19 [[Candida] subhashii]KAG7665947.1 GPI19 [[Candida] subhashii]
MSSLSLSILSRSSSPRPNPQEDSLARESDVTVSNITPSKEYQGFAIWVISSICLGCWICWTTLPESILHHQLSIYYYPDRYWAVAIPSYSLMLMVFIYYFLALYNTEVLTLKLDDVCCIVDEHSHFPGDVDNAKGIDVSRQELIDSAVEYIHNAPSGVWDLPITLVNEVLYNDDDNDSDDDNDEINI